MDRADWPRARDQPGEHRCDRHEDHPRSLDPDGSPTMSDVRLTNAVMTMAGQPTMSESKS